MPLHLRSKLGESFELFKQDFYKYCNSLNQEVFEQCWSNLFTKYPTAVNYLNKVLYLSKTSWAHAFNIDVFTIDVQTTSCCESVNSTFKQLLYNSNSLLIDIFLAVDERLEEEQDNEDYANWKMLHIYSLQLLFQVLLIK